MKDRHPARGFNSMQQKLFQKPTYLVPHACAYLPICVEMHLGQRTWNLVVRRTERELVVDVARAVEPEVDWSYATPSSFKNRNAMWCLVSGRGDVGQDADADSLATRILRFPCGFGVFCTTVPCGAGFDGMPSIPSQTVHLAAEDLRSYTDGFMVRPHLTLSRAGRVI